MYQAFSPIRVISEGKSTRRRTVASSRTSAARPTPSCLKSCIDRVANTANTATMMAAARVTARRWRASPGGPHRAWPGPVGGPPGRRDNELAEDLFLLRDGLTRLLEAHGCDVVAGVETGPALLDAIAEHHPDVAVVDVRLPPTFTDEGLRAALQARRDRQGFPVLVLSQYVEQLYARELLADGSGGVGYLLKDRVFDSAQFVDALRRVAGGGTAIDPEVIARLLALNSGARAGALGSLSRHEREVLSLMAEGRSNAAIAERLVVSERAVAKHTASIFMKLDLAPSDDDNRRVLAVLMYLGR